MPTSIAALVGLGTSTAQGIDSLNTARSMRRAQGKLEEDRRRVLAAEASARAAARDKAASAGSRTGARTGFIGGLGFGSGNSGDGIGAGTLFGN